MSGDNMLANAGFYSLNKINMPNGVKFKQKQQFESKVLVWSTLSSKGVSQPYIGTTKGAAINSDVYVQKCLPKLLTFIKTHHQHEFGLILLVPIMSILRSTGLKNEKLISFHDR